MSANLFNKYDIPAPRYTSYPTVPYWSESPTTDEWIDSLNRAFQSQADWAMYLHIPFCESLCSYCGCNTSITKNHNREMPYIDLLLKEWQQYKQQVQFVTSAPLKQLHIGGGTPTFLSPQNLGYLVSELLKDINVAEGFIGSIEVDPRTTNKEHLTVLRELGFSRVSLGVQDFSPKVQKLVHRIQPYEMTREITDIARDNGFTSINYDLIYGLPAQTEKSIMEMMEKTWSLKPDRIALYSLAIVPWVKPSQKYFKDEDLPKGEEKRRLYEISREFLLDKGYEEIGMDHFALPTDSLSISNEKGELHRNFMGYVEDRTQVLLGLGVSSISETPDCFHQNEKALPVYERLVGEDKIPTLRGHKLSHQDLARKEQILKFMNKGTVELESDDQLIKVKNVLAEMESDELIQFAGKRMTLTPKGKPFLRNACMALDERWLAEKSDKQIFSRAL